MPAEKPIMTDAEVAALLGVTLRTLQRRVKAPKSGELDLNDAKPTTFGGRRFWLRTNVERLLGITTNPSKGTP